MEGGTKTEETIIQQRMNELSDKIESLERNCVILVEKIGPVLKQGTDKAPEDMPAEEVISSGMEKFLRRKRNQVENINKIILGIFDKIEL